MEANFWHERWANNEIGWHESDFNPVLTGNFHRLELRKGARVFVPLCGKTRDILWLLQQGYQVAGSELSETAVQQLFTELDVQPTVSKTGTLQCYHAPGLDIFVGDIFAMTPALLGHVHATYDRAALVALPPDMRTRYTTHLQTLTHNAPQLLVCFEYDQSKMPGPPHSVSAVEVWGHYGSHYSVTLVEVRAVPGGLKGITAANELVWLLRLE